MKATQAQVIAALMEHAGVITHAAAALKIDRKGLTRRIARSPALKAAQAEAEDIVLDYGEGHLKKAVKDGDLQSVRFYLTHKGKSRGYGKFALEDDQLAALLGNLPPGALKGLADD